jgi:hypothetical protein
LPEKQGCSPCELLTPASPFFRTLLLPSGYFGGEKG